MSELNVLDASAVLAYLLNEKGAPAVDEAMDQRPSVITAVSAAEAMSKLIDHGMNEAAAELAVVKLRATIVPFTEALAGVTAGLRKQTRVIGASLGDRACLALATHLHGAGDVVRVLTGERSWRKIHWAFQVELIRP